MNSPRTHLVSILRGAPGGKFVVWKGVKCSTWVQISQPSCGRSYLSPLGFEDTVKCVKDANIMVARRGSQATGINLRPEPCHLQLFKTLKPEQVPIPPRHWLQERAGCMACPGLGGCFCVGTAGEQFAGKTPTVPATLHFLQGMGSTV